MPRVLVFDVNETLLDLNALNPHFERIFGDAAVRGQWFAQLIQSAFVATITNAYEPFGKVGGAALDMIAAQRGITLAPDDKKLLSETISSLPPHPDVRPGLEKLREAGFRLATLTNSTLAVAQAQMTNAGLRQFFDHVLSADTVQRLKPAPEPYQMAAEALAVELEDIRLVAAHAWDVAGALRAGCAAAFVARPNAVLDPLVPVPDIVGKNMLEVAEKIIEIDV